MNKSNIKLKLSLYVSWIYIFINVDVSENFIFMTIFWILNKCGTLNYLYSVTLTHFFFFRMTTFKNRTLFSATKTQSSLNTISEECKKQSKVCHCLIDKVITRLNHIRLETWLPVQWQSLFKVAKCFFFFFNYYRMYLGARIIWCFAIKKNYNEHLVSILPKWVL